MSWADTAAAAAMVEVAESTRWSLDEGQPAHAIEIASGVFALDWLQPDGARVHQVIDLRSEQAYVHLEVGGADPPP